MRDTYRALKERIGRGMGYVSPEEVQSAVYGQEAAADPKYGTRLRVAISVLERCGLVQRHLESGHAFRIEITPSPPGARAAIETLLESRRIHEERRMADMLAYAEGSGCRHVSIARHFDQTLDSAETPATAALELHAPCLRRGRRRRPPPICRTLGALYWSAARRFHSHSVEPASPKS